VIQTPAHDLYVVYVGELNADYHGLLEEFVADEAFSAFFSDPNQAASVTLLEFQKKGVAPTAVRALTAKQWQQFFPTASNVTKESIASVREDKHVAPAGPGRQLVTPKQHGLHVGGGAGAGAPIIAAAIAGVRV
jgi:hypothetical protein